MATGIHLNHQLTHRNSLAWDLKFTQRNNKLYVVENTKPFKPGRNEDGSPKNDESSKIDLFFTEQAHGLLPRDYSYYALRDFLSSANLSLLNEGQPIDLNSKDGEKIVLLDQRMDPSSLNIFTSRHWQGYNQYPPEGEEIFSGVLSAKDLCDKLNEEVSAYY